jgi:uncharacterized protein YcbK (DUF882 family)
MDQLFMVMLDRARDIAGIPFVINSAYRTVEHEKAQGRAGTSAHTLRCAVDIRCHDNKYRMKIIKALLEVGVKRIGIAAGFIHVDNSKTHAQDIIWTY